MAERNMDMFECRDNDDHQGCKFFTAKNRKIRGPLAAKNAKFVMGIIALQKNHTLYSYVKLKHRFRFQ